MNVMEQQGQDLFTQKRIELMMDVANKKVLAEVQLLRKMVTQLEQELVELRKKISDRPQLAQTDNKPSQDAPRYGDYTSEDVSVEKMFNFSGKK
jgi:uncharacterized protein YydD (DUF2326 family)